MKDLYSAEKQWMKALPKWPKAASSDELRQGFEDHLEQTKGHVERLDEIFSQSGAKATGKKCMGMEGLVKEGAEIMGEDFSEDVMDAALISAAQRVEHYQIAARHSHRFCQIFLVNPNRPNCCRKHCKKNGKPMRN